MRNRSNRRGGLLFTLGGFIGNFIFSLADHAANGFFFPAEWSPVIASAIAVGFLSVLVLMPVSRLLIQASAAVLLLETALAFGGFVLHTVGNPRGPSIRTFDNFMSGAPAMAPLLFPNPPLLGVIGLWH